MPDCNVLYRYIRYNMFHLGFIYAIYAIFLGEAGCSLVWLTTCFHILFNQAASIILASLQSALLPSLDKPNKLIGSRGVWSDALDIFCTYLRECCALRRTRKILGTDGLIWLLQFTTLGENSFQHRLGSFGNTLEQGC